MNVYCMNVTSPVGPLTLTQCDGAITRIDFGCTKYKAAKKAETPLLLEAKRQLDSYFGGRLKCFDLPLKPHGTDFQKFVWNALTQIPYGQTRSYAFIAEAVGNPRAVQAVGQANRFNPIPIIIPCHRVIRSSGEMGGYAGGLEAKSFLLSFEKMIISRDSTSC